jgi:hypothetical protein
VGTDDFSHDRVEVERAVFTIRAPSGQWPSTARGISDPA